MLKKSSVMVPSSLAFLFCIKCFFTHGSELVSYSSYIILKRFENMISYPASTVFEVDAFSSSSKDNY